MNTKIKDKRIVESSGLIMGRRNPDIAYTIQDDTRGATIYGIDAHTGNTVIEVYVDNLKIEDCEWISMDLWGNFWLGVTGDKERKRTDRALVKVEGGEPAIGFKGKMKGIKFPIRYPDNEKWDCETGIYDVDTNAFYLFTKYKTTDIFRFEIDKAVANKRNDLEYVHSLKSSFLTDGIRSNISGNSFFRLKGKQNILVLDSKFGYKGWISKGVSKVKQPESIALYGIKLYYGSEGKNSPLNSIEIPEKFR